MMSVNIKDQIEKLQMWKSVYAYTSEQLSEIDKEIEALELGLLYQQYFESDHLVNEIEKEMKSQEVKTDDGKSNYDDILDRHIDAINKRVDLRVKILNKTGSGGTKNRPF